MKTKGQFHTFRIAGMIGVSALVLAVSPALAQIDQATGIADPSRAGDEIKQPDMTPEVTPELKVNQAAPLNAPKGSENVKFTLKGVHFSGATIYNDAQLEALFNDKLGQTISVADVYTIANAVTLKYRNDGYILTQVVVTENGNGDGTPTLRVVEGFIQNITLQKEDQNASIDMANIESYASQISKGGPLNARDLERELLIINDLPGITARSVLSPSSTPGAADMVIILSYDPYDGLLSVDNYGSRFLGPLQLGASATLNSMLGMNEAITGQIVMAPQSWYELGYLSAGYEQPIGPYGTKAHFNGSVTDTEPGYTLREFDVEGRSYLLNVGVTHPFIRSRAENLYGRLNLDWRRVKSENNIEETRRDRLTVARAGGRFEFIDTIFMAAANTIDAEVSKGLGILGASDEGDDNMTRDLADPQFTKLEVEFQRLERITNGVNLLLGARGQLASNALLSSEEFAVGGINSGRGYDPSEITGDHGISGKVELQWNDPVKFDTNFLESYQLFGFWDIGRVWNEDFTTSAQKRDSVASVGAGVRFDLPYDVDAGFAIAVPMTRRVATQDRDGGDRDPKVYFNLSKRF